MDLVVTLFLAMLAFTFTHMAMCRWLGATDAQNTIWLAAGVGSVLALTSVIAGAAFVPFPLCFLIFLLVHHYDMGVGRALAVIVLLALLAYGVEYGLAPLVHAMFSGPDGYEELQ